MDPRHHRGQTCSSLELGHHRELYQRTLENQPMSRIALLVGIDHYPHDPLTGCAADAKALEQLLATNHDGSPNVLCKTLISGTGNAITRASLRDQISLLFSKSDAELALFFFAGHGFRHPEYGGHIVTPDATSGDEGVTMNQVIEAANKSSARERVIILDCCHSGAAGDFLPGRALLNEGVAILAGCRSEQTTVESGGRGLLSRHLCDALDGGAADVTGQVTLGGLYAYVDEVLTAWDQRPLLKANIARLTSLRRAEPAVALETLRRLPDYFPLPEVDLLLDPSFEPTAEPGNEKNEAIFGHLQRFRAARLVVPVGTEHLYYAAMESRACRLTPLGRFYWHRVERRQL